MFTSILSIIAGLIMLIVGGDWLVDGAVGIARLAKLSPMVIGLTIVAFGTSAPELLVSVQAALGGNPGIALGNVVGSNIANIALIIGVTALICPIPVHRSTIKVDVPFLLFSTIALTLISYLYGSITRTEGIIGLTLLFLFVAYQVRTSRKQEKSAVEPAEDETPPAPLWKSIVFLALGIAALKYGAQFLVDGAVNIAEGLGVADRVIGVTVVAIGTSLPELFASVMAARKGNVDLAVGNVIGSNLFNIMCVLASASVISPIPDVGPGFTNDCIWMLALTLLIALQLRTDYRLTRLEGAILLVSYTTFITMTII